MKLICPDCKSKDIRHLRKTDSYWCRHCGHTWPRIAKKKKGANNA